MSESKKSYRMSSAKKSPDMPAATKVAEYEQEIENLCTHIKNLEDELQRLTESRYRLDQAFKHNEKLTSALKEAVEAEEGGADFITVGPIFETESKLRYGAPIGITKFADVCEKVKIPVFAIGGINMERVGSVMKEGAYGVAVISAVLKAESVHDAAVNMLDELRYS